ncbi:MAG: acetate--CoA ligase family protein [candidate division KSB1 bacterium]|nr:acetate--CoA ligase family protein [candidate division KSB1 bacterium]
MSLEKFFDPKSVAIVGASQKKGKVGYEILWNLKNSGFEGDLFPVNHKTDQIEGLKCYPDLESIGSTPDLVLIIVPAKVVPNIMEQCVKLGVDSVIIITAGFKEVGEEGKKLEKKIRQIARRGNVRFIGPNCLGVISTSSKLNASFGGDLPVKGGTAYISQSGALLAAILDMANDQGIGFSKLVSIGNKADVNELDVIEALADDSTTRVIAGYLESIDDGNEFARVAEEISSRKPMILIKSGGSSAGAKAASSHTGSLAGGEQAYEAVFKKSGIVRCKSIMEQFNYARAFANQPLPTGSRVAVITNAGGPGIMTADSIEAHGLDFASLSQETEDKLAENLPAAANIHNPIDVLGDALADRYEYALDVVMEDDKVDAVIVVLTPQAMTESEKTAKAIVKISKEKPDKPIFACFMGASKVDEGVAILQKGKIPQYSSPEDAVNTLQVMIDYTRWRSRPKRVVKLFPVNRHKVEKVIDKHLREGKREVGETEAKGVLEAYGFATPQGTIATSPEHAATIAEQIGFPVVMKIWSPDIIHKSDVGGVKVGLRSLTEVKDAFDLMMYRIPQKQPDANILGVLVEKMSTGGKEVILGMNRDSRFGPLMMFGMGGTMVEVLKDVSFSLAPITADEAKQMLKSTKTYQMLEGVRGEEGVDIDALAESLQRLSQLVTEFPQIQELDINPFVIGPPGVTPIAVDARMSVEENK